MKRKIVCFLSVLITFLFVGCMMWDNSTGSKSTEYEYLEESFSGRIIAVLDSVANLNLENYGIEKFPEIELENVQELTHRSTALLRLQKEAERTGCFSKIQKFKDSSMLINPGGSDEYGIVLLFKKLFIWWLISFFCTEKDV